MDVGHEAIARIDFYKRSGLMLMATLLAPLAFGVLMSLVMLAVAIAQGRSWLFQEMRGVSTVLAVAVTLIAAAVPFLISISLVRARARRNLKDFYSESDYDLSDYESWKSALESVSVGLGTEPPPLKVLGIGTVNSIAFREKGGPGIGVTAEALKAGLNRYQKEAMMAHEMAHISMGDYFLASSSAGFEYLGYGLGVLFLLMAALVTVMVSPYLLLFLIPLALPLGVVLAEGKLRKKKRLLYRHNDLLADTIAARLTSDPESLRKTVEALWAFSETTTAHIPRTAHFQGYLFVSRPLEAGPIKMVTYERPASAPPATTPSETTKIYWVPGKTESRTAAAYDSVRNRIENLRSIERGQWTELERPIQRERTVRRAGLATVVVLVAVVAAAPFLPVKGKTAWSAATTNAVWDTTGRATRARTG
jgi:Zn-dependent protease with chaperone function